MPEDNTEKDDLSGLRLVLKEMKIRKFMSLLLCGDFKMHYLVAFIMCA